MENETYSSSEFIEPSSFSKEWMGITCLQVRSRNALYVATRYGRRFLLKAIKKEYQGFTNYQVLHDKEFRLGVSLNHPHIAATYALEEVSGIGLCIVQEYVEGVTLGEWLKKDPSFAARKRVLLQLLDALQYIHSLQLVHHDLKLGNVMITTNAENVKLVDFGLSTTDDSLSATPNTVQKDLAKLGELIKQLTGNKYLAVANKCLQNGYPNIEAVQQAIKRRTLMPWMVMAGVVLLGILVAVMTPIVKEAYQTYQQEQVKKQATSDLILMQQEILALIDQSPCYEVALMYMSLFNKQYNSYIEKLTMQERLVVWEVFLPYYEEIASACKTRPSMSTFSVDEQIKYIKQIKQLEEKLAQPL